MSLIGRPKVCSNLLTSAKLQFSTSPLNYKSHYDTLGITPKATQNDIKSAYYELTKIYHPDKNQTEEAKIRFRSITDAYEILGNYKSRKMYDRGMRPGPRHMDAASPEEVKKDDAQTRFYKSRMYRSKVPAPDGRTPIYNFDEWAKAHYGDLFNQSRSAKEKWEIHEEYRIREDLRSNNNKVWVPLSLVILLLSTGIYTKNSNQDYDRNKLTSDKKEPRSS